MTYNGEIKKRCNNSNQCVCAVGYFGKHCEYSGKILKGKITVYKLGPLEALFWIKLKQKVCPVIFLKHINCFLTINDIEHFSKFSLDRGILNNTFFLL